eukprot:scaffold279_cov229-Pinguiococcus_pyrenoidosus.AAC.30
MSWGLFSLTQTIASAHSLDQRPPTLLSRWSLTTYLSYRGRFLTRARRSLVFPKMSEALTRFILWRLELESTMTTAAQQLTFLRHRHSSTLPPCSPGMGCSPCSAWSTARCFRRRALRRLPCTPRS